MDILQLFSQVQQKCEVPFMSLKKEQLSILTHVMAKQNCIGVLPTGFGKSACFWLTPLMWDEILPAKAPHVALVVSPLKSLMADQMSTLKDLDIPAVTIRPMADMSVNDINRVKKGDLSVIFASPEALKQGPWVQYFQDYSSRFCLMALDEVHCLSEWGQNFRTDYQHVVVLRSTFTEAPVLGLSATVNPKVLQDVSSMLQMDDYHLIDMLPDRPNIYLNVIHQHNYDYERDLAWIVDDVRSQNLSFPKTLIYAETVGIVSRIYEFLRCTLGRHAFCNPDDPDPNQRLISMFHGHIGQDLSQFIIQSFSKPQSKLRLVVCTIAFGMGIQVCDVTRVIHWGRCSTVMGYWQEVGRAGRNGQLSTATWYPKSTKGFDQDLFESIKKDLNVCVRQKILSHFVLSHNSATQLANFDQRSACKGRCDVCLCERCQCCNHCRMQCPCRLA